jgi:hypothetical protein
MIKLRNLLESTLGSHYPGDAGEKETGYLRGGKTRHLGIKAGKPEPWFEGGGYEQMDFPVADFIYGKAAPEDMVVKKKVIRAIEPVTKFNENLHKASKLTDADIKIGDAYHVKSHQGQMIEFVYKKTSYGWITVEYQFKPQYGDPGFMSVANTRADGVDGWGKNKKIKVTSQMKKHMVKTLQDAIKSKYKGSEETNVLLRNNLRLSNVLSFIKRI